MSSLVEKLRESRKVEVKVGDITFTGIRATIEQALTYNGDQISDAEICRRHITGWDGVKESDVFGGSDKQPVAFDKNLFNEVIGDNMEWWVAIAPKIIEDALNRLKERGDNTKKSKSG